MSTGGPQARSDVLYRELADGGLIYGSTSKQVHHLNETAALAWLPARC